MLGGIARTYPAPARARRVARVRNEAYQSGSTAGRRIRGWLAPTVGPNEGVLSNLRTLRDRSRAGVRNDGYAGRAIDRLVSNIVGTGIEPQSQAPDETVQERLEQLWLDWTDDADATGMLDLYGLQAQAVRGWLEGGEMFIRLRERRLEDGLVVPLQLELVEPELCPIEYTVVAAGGVRVRAGVEFDALGRRVAYWLYRQRPGAEQDLDTSRLVRVPAASVLHLYDPLRAGQIRGLPQLTQALLKLYDLDQYDDATLLRQKLANLYVAFLTHQGPAPEGDLDPTTGRAIERDGDEARLPLQPGLFQELGVGENVIFSDPPDALGYADFMRAQLMGAAVASDVPYEVLTGDLRAVNDRTVRVVLNEFRRRIEQRQHHIVAHMLLRPIWRAFIGRAVLAGAIEMPAVFFADPGPWIRVEWVPPAWPYLHPVQDVEAETAMVRAGYKSRTQVTRERGARARQIEAEVAADNARADRHGLRFESDARVPTSGAASAPPPEPVDDAGDRVLARAALDVARAAAERTTTVPITVHAPTTIAEGAVRLEAPITIQPAQTTIAEGAVQVSPSPVTIAEGAVCVSLPPVPPPARPPRIRKRVARDAQGRITDVIDEPLED